MKRKPFDSKEAVDASSNAELIALFKEKAATNPDGVTMRAVADVNLQRLDKGERDRKVLEKQGFRRPRGHYGIARQVVHRLAPNCSTLAALIAAMQREKRADGEIVDIVDEEVAFYKDGRTSTVQYKTLRGYLREERKKLHLG